MSRTKRAESRARYFVRSLAQKRGWNTAHVSRNGDFLEEQEIIDAFPDIGLGLKKPDFLVCLKSEPVLVIETKNEFQKVDLALTEAIEYADIINSSGKYHVKLAVGVAGEPDHGYQVEVRYLTNQKWLPLTSRTYPLTTIPAKSEVELAILADDATTDVSFPGNAEFVEVAIEISSIMRTAKIESALRPKVLGAIITALYQGEIDLTSGRELDSINALVKAAVTNMKLAESKRERLISALLMTGNDYDRLAPKIGRIISLLKRLNIRSVLQSDADFLGLFYENFLRYGYDNNALGIVFTPRHITRFCVDLVGVGASDRVIDIACGTGGFLVSAFDRMLTHAKGQPAREQVKSSIFGFDTNPTVWALATLNMFFRGDGKSNITNGDCFDHLNRAEVKGKFTRAFLNPPFSQKDEPERDFIDAALDTLEPGGVLCCVVKAGIFADRENSKWRDAFTKRHSVVGVISLPDDLFYPTAAPTAILIAKAHIPTSASDQIFLARIVNDGYQKLKGKRVEGPGSQLPEIKGFFREFEQADQFQSNYAATVSANLLLGGQEFSPQQWLQQPATSKAKNLAGVQKTQLSILQSIAAIPEVSNAVLKDFPKFDTGLPKLPLKAKKPVSFFFNVGNGKSAGETNYTDGNTPYISSGDICNSIIRLVESNDDEVFPLGGLTVTAFGQAYVQPWPFLARGNGGSSVRVLTPKFEVSLNELCWFATQINNQRWRFFYGRMAIKTRLGKLVIQSPDSAIPDNNQPIFQRATELRRKIEELSAI